MEWWWNTTREPLNNRKICIVNGRSKITKHFNKNQSINFRGLFFPRFVDDFFFICVCSIQLFPPEYLVWVSLAPNHRQRWARFVWWFYLCLSHWNMSNKTFTSFLLRPTPFFPWRFHPSWWYVFFLFLSIFGFCGTSFCTWKFLPLKFNWARWLKNRQQRTETVRLK